MNCITIRLKKYISSFCVLVFVILLSFDLQAATININSRCLKILWRMMGCAHSERPSMFLITIQHITTVRASAWLEMMTR